MPQTHLSRRALFGFASAATAGAALPSIFATPAAHAQQAEAIDHIQASTLRRSVDKAIAFQNFMMDAYATGSTVRLTQSYSDEALLTTAFTYDNAVSIQAYLAHGSSDSVARAQVLGNGLLYAQSHNFPYNDGRFAQAYFVGAPAADNSGAYISPAAAPYYFYTSAVGDQAWAGMALAQLYLRTGLEAYLTGALKVANWIVTNAYSTAGPGGYTFGTNISPSNISVPSPNGKSTEHNIDTYAFFTMLTALTHDASANNGMRWSSLAEHALLFVAAMYNPAGPYFYTGTLGDQVSINPSPIPEDCQTWSYMATLRADWRHTIDWALANLETTDTSSAPHSSLTGKQKIHGLVFDTASLTTTVYDPYAVWLEGTGHAIAALITRVLRGADSIPKSFEDLSTALALIQQCEKAQNLLGADKKVGGHAIPQGLGLVAATSIMDTGFGYTYGPSLHIGATGWYLLGALGGNPFQLGYKPSRGA